MNVFRMAWRNVWRNPRRSVVTVGAMAFALWVMVLYSALVEGYLHDMGNDVLDNEVGEIQVHALGYRDKPSLYDRIDDVPRRLAALEQGGYRVSPRLQSGGLAASGEQSAGVSLVGVDVLRDAGALGVASLVVQGSWLDPADPEGVVVGRRLARALGADVGAEVVVLTQGADGSMANALYRVRGVLGSVGDGTDRAGLFLTEGAFRELLIVPEGVHQLIVRVPADADLALAVADVAERVGQLDVVTWRDLMPIVAQMLDSTRGLIYIIFVVVYIAVGILILNAMLMAVFERIREFGVMKAIGVGPGMVLALIATETAIQLGAAIAIGLTLAVPGAIYLSTVGLNMTSLAGASVVGLTMPARWMGRFSVGSATGPVVVLVVIVGLAVIYPALKAALVQPVTAMRYR
jgi:putative ABC transport system permease protein